MIGKGVARGRYTIKNPDKYAGTKTPIYRSSWEWAFMQFCDTNKSVIGWASEAVRIPYRNPLTGKQSSYVPDFFVQYQDANGKKRSELVEIKPSNQSTMEGAGKSKNRQAAVVQNMAKWEAATAWCKQKRIRFRVITENDLFHNGKKHR
jgi:hypothetical protein